MAKNLEQLLEDMVVPDMEYEPKYKNGKNAAHAVTVDDVPEVVLPKTKAEMYREAKGRLGEKTKAASGATTKRKKSPKPVKVKTVELEIAAVSQTAERTESEQIKARKLILEKPVDEPVWVGGTDELIPFAWRKPLIADIDKPNKNYRQAVRSAKELQLPALRGK